MVNKVTIVLILCILWIIFGITLALWPPPAIIWGSKRDSLIMFTIIGGRLGSTGITNSTETVIWVFIILLFALVLAFTLNHQHFFIGLIIGVTGGSIAAFLQLLLMLQGGRIWENQSWLDQVPLDFLDWKVQIGLASFAGIARGLLLGIIAAVLASFLSPKITQLIGSGLGQNSKVNTQSHPKTIIVKIQIAGSIHEFDNIKQQQIIEAIAAKLKVKPEDIKVLAISSGSILVTLEMPEEWALKLVELHMYKDPFISNLAFV